MAKWQDKTKSNMNDSLTFEEATFGEKQNAEAEVLKVGGRYWFFTEDVRVDLGRSTVLEWPEC